MIINLTSEEVSTPFTNDFMYRCCSHTAKKKIWVYIVHWVTAFFHCAQHQPCSNRLILKFIVLFNICAYRNYVVLTLGLNAVTCIEKETGAAIVCRILLRKCADRPPYRRPSHAHTYALLCAFLGEYSGSMKRLLPMLLLVFESLEEQR